MFRNRRFMLVTSTPTVKPPLNAWRVYYQRRGKHITCVDTLRMFTINTWTSWRVYTFLFWWKFAKVKESIDIRFLWTKTKLFRVVLLGYMSEQLETKRIYWTNCFDESLITNIAYRHEHDDAFKNGMCFFAVDLK